MNGWVKHVISGLIGAAVVGLLAWGALSNQVSTNTDQIRRNTDTLASLTKEQSSMATNIEWIRRTLEKNPYRKDMP